MNQLKHLQKLLQGKTNEEIRDMLTVEKENIAEMRDCIDKTGYEFNTSVIKETKLHLLIDGGYKLTGYNKKLNSINEIIYQLITAGTIPDGWELTRI